MRLADQLSDVDLLDLHDLLLEGKSRAGVGAAVAVEPGPSVLVDSALTLPTAMWTWTCAFRLLHHPVAVVFAGEYTPHHERVERELLRTAQEVRRRLAQVPALHGWVPGGA